MTAYERPWVATDVEVDDGTGMPVLRFMGRSGVQRMAPGHRITAEGTPGLSGGALVMLNPVYSFDDRD